MKYFLIAMAYISIADASVSRGRGDTYHVDNMGSSYEVNDTREHLKIQFVDSASIQTPVKGFRPTAIY